MATQTNAIAKSESGGTNPLAVIEQVLVQGNLATLPVEQRVLYYNRVCESVGLNPLTRPFEYITLNNKLVLYARRDATDQLRKIHGVSIVSLESKQSGDLLIVVAQASDKQGRTDTATGVVSMKGLSGENQANAMMKAETKAKRRVTLSLCGLGILDETELGDGDSEVQEVVQPQRASAAQPRELTAAPVATPNEKKSEAGEALITAEQRKALYQICVEVGWGNDQVKEILKKDFGFDSSTKITVAQYDKICRFFKREETAPFQATDEDIPW